MKKFTVSLEDIIHNIPAYELDTNGWNGWACPGFEHSQAELALTQLKCAAGIAVKWAYSEEFDCFLVKGMNESSEVFTGSTYQTEDGPKKLYAVGAWAWIWSVT